LYQVSISSADNLQPNCCVRPVRGGHDG